jgi:hypothetical protein
MFVPAKLRLALSRRQSSPVGFIREKRFDEQQLNRQNLVRENVTAMWC